MNLKTMKRKCKVDAGSHDDTRNVYLRGLEGAPSPRLHVYVP